MYYLLSIHSLYYISFHGMNLYNIFGFMLFSIFIIQFITGVLLVCYFNNIFILSFDSILYIMIEVIFGYLIRGFHCIFSILFIFILFIHIFRGLWLRLIIIDSLSFVWISGLILFILILIEGFIGYILNFGQMSYWGYMVLIGLLSILGIFDYLFIELLWCCCYVVLFRIFCLHFSIGWLLGIFMIIHILLLHAFGSINSSIYSYSSFIISFYLVIFKDIYLYIYIIYFIYYLLYSHPDILGNSDNLIFANPLSTPNHIVPELYFLVLFYILRNIPIKNLGIICIGIFMVYFIL